GAGLAIMPLIMWLNWGEDVFRSPHLTGPFMVVVAVLMVSRVPTYSGKHMRLKPQLVVPLMILIGLIAAFLVTDTWSTLTVIGLAYLGAIPGSVPSFSRLKRGPLEPDSSSGH